MFRFTKIRRLLHKIDYDRVFAQAKKIMTDELIVIHRKNSLGYARLGFAISKKTISRANQRNRLKRIVRESFRTQTLPNIDVIVLARKGAALIENKVINSNLSTAWKKLTDFYVN